LSSINKKYIESSRMSSFYCSNCKVELKNNETMKDHYKSEFHRYNIKRHLVNLPPVTLEQFEKKKAQLAETSKAAEEETFKCDICNKSFNSKATLQQHLESKKHKDEAKKAASQSNEIQMVKKEKKEETGPRLTTAEDPTVCLFCNFKSSDINENLIHMRLQHSFFVSDIKHIKDLPGLLRYLGEKIHRGCLCIYCENHHCHDFKTGEAVQRHMIDKGHCFMKTEEFDEYYKFYDFTDELAAVRNKLLIADDKEPLKEDEAYLEMVSGDEDSEDDEWEDADEDEDEDEDDEEDGKVKDDATAAKEMEITDEKEIKEKKEKRVHRFKVKKVKVLSTGEIQLPNGRILGHRKYNDLYKQYYREKIRQDQNKLYLEYVGERAVATINQQNALVLARKLFERNEKIKRSVEIADYTRRVKKGYVHLGCKHHLLVKHFRFQNPK